MLNTAPHILAIDQSTSATKALIFDAKGGLLAKSSRPHRQIYPQPGWVEHDAEEIWSNTLTVIKEVVERNPKFARNLEILSITNQRETVVIFDRATGRPLHNAIVWQCHRSDSICADLFKAGHEEYVHRCTGLRINAYFSASKLKWLVDNRPEIAAKLTDGSALIGTLDTYLIYRLTNGQVFATDSTNASRTLLFDIGYRKWQKQLCELFHVPPASLPDVRDCDTNFGTTSAGGTLPHELPICGVMGDSQASLFAMRCFQPGMAKVTFGSGCSLLINTGSEKKLTDNGVLTTLAWVLNGQPVYALEGVINYSAATIEWLKNQLKLIDDASETEALAKSVSDNSGVYLVPAFAGLSAPYWKPDARAAIVGMSSHSTKAHVVRAALESIAYQLCDVLEMIHTNCGIVLNRISADGGATNNEFLMQFTADMTRVELHKTHVAESSALGAAICGALGRGWYSSLDDIPIQPIGDVLYSPVLEEDAAHLNRRGWRQATECILSNAGYSSTVTHSSSPPDNYSVPRHFSNDRSLSRGGSKST